MGYSERIDNVKSEIDSLITYANGVTGESDTSIGDAILTLCGGFGSGDLNVVFDKNFILDQDCTQTTWTNVYTFDDNINVEINKLFAIIITRLDVPHDITGYETSPKIMANIARSSTIGAATRITGNPKGCVILLDGSISETDYNGITINYVMISNTAKYAVRVRIGSVFSIIQKGTYNMKVVQLN